MYIVISADKYCSLVEAEGGLKLLNELLLHPAPYKLIKDLARTVITNCARYATLDLANPPTPLTPDN